MYLQHHGSQKSTSDKAKNILFYALWVLYALSAASGIIGIIGTSFKLGGPTEHRDTIPP